jgi:hypothetical protein
MLDEATIARAATEHGFKKRRVRNWMRRTPDFIQLVNLQRSAWSNEVPYTNFALWPLELGEPDSLAESKFHFRARAEDLGATDAQDLFAIANALQTLDALRVALAEREIPALISVDLRSLLNRTH